MSVEKAAAVVIAESRRLERLVRDLLDLARLNQRSFSVHPRPIDLTGLVALAVSRHGPESTRVGVALIGETNGRSPAVADPDRALQVLSNLIENALRSTPAGGSVTVAAHPGELVVSDTGPGIAAEELPHAFERFFLYSRYASNRAVGTGLGLGNQDSIPYIQTDFVFAAVAQQMGLFGATLVIVAFMLIVGSGLRIAARADLAFDKLLAVGLTTLIGTQSFLIISGVVRLLPLTGLALPFVSYGGSSLVSSWILIALLLRISDESNRRVLERAAVAVA